MLLGTRIMVVDLLLDLLVIGTGAATQVLSPETRKTINEMGIRVEVSDTRNAAAQYNLLATERGVNEVGALLVPVGWKPKK
jgi:NADH dehydrogenase [ubiquinone] 1 alpha subcomplex assembly factor 3